LAAYLRLLRGVLRLLMLLLLRDRRIHGSHSTSFRGPSFLV